MENTGSARPASDVRHGGPGRFFLISRQRHSISQAIKRFARTRERVPVTTPGGVRAVLISEEELADLDAARETAEVLADPNLMQQLRESEEDIAAGRVFTVDELRADLERRRAAEE